MDSTGRRCYSVTQTVERINGQEEEEEECNTPSFLSHSTTIITVFFIPVRGRFRVDINKTQSNRYTINLIVHLQSELYLF